MFDPTSEQANAVMLLAKRGVRDVKVDPFPSRCAVLRFANGVT